MTAPTLQLEVLTPDKKVVNTTAKQCASFFRMAGGGSYPDMRP